MSKTIVVYNKEACIGCGACEAVCPENWELITSEGKAKPKNLELDEIGNNKEAQDICPTNAIKLETKG